MKIANFGISSSLLLDHNFTGSWPIFEISYALLRSGESGKLGYGLPEWISGVEHKGKRQKTIKNKPTTRYWELPQVHFILKFIFFMLKWTALIRQIQGILKHSNWFIGSAATLNLVRVVRNLRLATVRHPCRDTHFGPPIGPELMKMHGFGLVGSEIAKSTLDNFFSHISQPWGCSTCVQT